MYICIYIYIYIYIYICYIYSSWIFKFFSQGSTGSRSQWCGHSVLVALEMFKFWDGWAPVREKKKRCADSVWLFNSISADISFDSYRSASSVCGCNPLHYPRHSPTTFLTNPLSCPCNVPGRSPGRFQPWQGLLLWPLGCETNGLWEKKQVQLF